MNYIPLLFPQNDPAKLQERAGGEGGGVNSVSERRTTRNLNVGRKMAKTEKRKRWPGL